MLQSTNYDAPHNVLQPPNTFFLGASVLSQYDFLAHNQYVF